MIRLFDNFHVVLLAHCHLRIKKSEHSVLFKKIFYISFKKRSGATDDTCSIPWFIYAGLLILLFFFTACDVPERELTKYL